MTTLELDPGPKHGITFFYVWPKLSSERVAWRQRSNQSKPDTSRNTSQAHPRESLRILTRIGFLKMAGHRRKELAIFPFTISFFLCKRGLKRYSILNPAFTISLNFCAFLADMSHIRHAFLCYWSTGKNFACTLPTKPSASNVTP